MRKWTHWRDASGRNEKITWYSLSGVYEILLTDVSVRIHVYIHGKFYGVSAHLLCIYSIMTLHAYNEQPITMVVHGSMYVHTYCMYLACIVATFECKGFPDTNRIFLRNLPWITTISRLIVKLCDISFFIVYTQHVPILRAANSNGNISVNRI